MSPLKNVVALLGLFLAASIVTAAELNVVTDRSDFHLKPLLEQFQQQTGVTVNAAYLEEGGLIPRIKARPSEADVIITTDSAALAYLKNAGYTQKLPFNANINAVFKDTDYVILSYRVRAMVARNDNTAKLVGYEDLANGKHSVCVRPLTHAYNINIVSQMIADRGEAYARSWVAGLVKNIAVQPQGNDRKQAELVAQGKCELGIMNSYYYGLMLTNNAQRGYASNLHLFYPDQSGKGSYVLMSGAAINKSAANKEDAAKLIEFMLSPVAQSFISNVNFEYPVTDATALPKMVQGFAEGQDGIKNGIGKFNFIKPADIAKNRDLAVQIIEQATLAK
jgi:iron(III) transport system substrate-binding protein